MILTPVKEINNLRIYERKRGHETFVPKQLVVEPDGFLIQECRRLREAVEFWILTPDYARRASGSME